MWAVRKTIGVCRNRLVSLMMRASSKPLTPGILMSRTMTATSCSRSRRRARSESSARSRRYPGSPRIASRASRFRGSSSTSRMSIGGGIVHLAVEPDPQQRQELLGVDRLGDVARATRLEALLPIALHRLGGEGNDRQRAQRGIRADLTHRLVAVHLG